MKEGRGTWEGTLSVCNGVYWPSDTSTKWVVVECMGTVPTRGPVGLFLDTSLGLAPNSVSEERAKEERERER